MSKKRECENCKYYIVKIGELGSIVAKFCDLDICIPTSGVAKNCDKYEEVK